MPPIKNPSSSNAASVVASSATPTTIPLSPTSSATTDSAAANMTQSSTPSTNNINTSHFLPPLPTTASAAANTNERITSVAASTIDATAAASTAAASASAVVVDSDDDMSGNESQRSGSSRGDRGQAERDSSGEDADEPDSDDSSEMDESECERRRNDCIDNLANLERQFGILREQLYGERINQVDMQLADIRGGRSQEYLGPLQELNENLRTRTEVASVLRTLQTQNIQHKFDSEELAAVQHYESEKRLAMDHIYDELMDKVRRLEEDRHNVDISWADWGTSTRTSKVRGPGKKKAVTVTGPYIVYMLADEDILEDWKIIRKALKRTPTAASAVVGVGGGGVSGS